MDTSKCENRNGAPQANASESKRWKVRGVQWRVNLGVLPSNPAPIDELRRGAADCRRRLATFYLVCFAARKFSQMQFKQIHKVGIPYSVAFLIRAPIFE